MGGIGANYQRTLIPSPPRNYPCEQNSSFGVRNSYSQRERIGPRRERDDPGPDTCQTAPPAIVRKPPSHPNRLREVSSAEPALCGVKVKGERYGGVEVLVGVGGWKFRIINQPDDIFAFVMSELRFDWLHIDRSQSRTYCTQLLKSSLTVSTSSTRPDSLLSLPPSISVHITP
jgi:hypothetical protein